MSLVAAWLAAATFSLAAMQRVVILSGAVISPDASRLAFIVSRVNANHNRYDDTLTIESVRTGSLHEVAGHHSIGALQWSPDGSQLAAVMDQPSKDVSQLYLIDASTHAVRQLTVGKTDVSEIAWDPAGKRIAFTRRDYVPPKSGADAYRDAFRVDDNAYLELEAPSPVNLWLVSLQGAERHLTSGSQSVMDAPLSWSPQGRYLIFERGPAVHGVQDKAYAVRLDVSSGELRQQTPHSAYMDQAMYSPDGSQIGYLYPRAGDPASQTEAWLATSNGAADRDVSLGLDRQVSTLAWMPDSRAMLLQVDDRTKAPLVTVSVSGAVRVLPLGPVAAAAIESQGSVARDGSIVFVGRQAADPNEIYLLRPGASGPTRLTSFNAPIARLHLARETRITWRSSEGYEEDGVLTYPPGFVPGRRYPLVLRIHGGPYESSMAAFEPFYQLAASHGYLVFAPNYRGSTDLGNAYLRGIFNDPNTGPSRDIMAGIAAVERLGIVDESRIGVSGWSYGGQLTSWLEGHYYIWRAAVAGAAVNDLVVDYAIADDIDADRIMFTQSSPYRGNALALWRQNSPLSYFNQIRTPTLIMGNVYDVRVPIVESYEMFHALSDNGVPVEFYAYPSHGHLPNGPVREADAYQRWLAWFDRWLKGP